MGVEIGRPQYKELKQAWGEWLDEVGDRKGGWDWFVTLTFRDPPPERAALGWNKIGMAYANRAWDSFVGEVGDRLGLQVEHWFCGMEEQKARGVPHLHGLMGGVGELRRDAAWAYWHERYGFARILPYDRNMGARFYVCKYVSKELTDWRFSDNLDL